MIRNIDDTIKFLQLNKIEYWKVQLKDADNSLIFEADESTFADNEQRFRDVMELCTGSRFIIKGSEKKGINRGNFLEEFKNVPEVPGIPKVEGLPQVQGVPVDEVERRISAAIDGLKREQKMEALENENKELKQTVREFDSMQNRILGKLEPYIGTIIQSVAGKIFPQQPSVQLAGVEYEKDENDTEDENPEHESSNPKPQIQNGEHRLTVALEKWQKADPDNFIRLIEFIADFASSDKKISPFPGINLGYTEISEMLK